MIVEPTYRGYRIEIEASPPMTAGMARSGFLRLFSRDKPKREIVTGYNVMAAEIVSRRQDPERHDVRATHLSNNPPSSI